MNLFGLSLGGYHRVFYGKGMMMKSESAPVYAAQMLEMDAAKGSAKEMPSEEKDDALMANESAVSKFSEREKEKLCNGLLLKNLQKPEVTPRTNLNETAFFLPQLQTDADGNVILNFQMPEALTKWNFLGLAAHEKS